MAPIVEVRGGVTDDRTSTLPNGRIISDDQDGHRQYLSIIVLNFGAYPHKQTHLFRVCGPS